MKKLIKISLLVSIIAFYITCRDESMSLSTDIIENPKVLDVSNSNNASDLIVLFRVKESNLTITTARVGLAKSSTYTSFTTEDAKSLSGASFAEINNIVPNKLISVRLPSSLLDIDGDPISHTTSYKVVYMFVAGG
ncbi:MAG: hypothetical protein KDC53_17455 [Saprospiraceae bacterium]|nr:hypothetical protein [Saprospiraceae bacterium]